MKKLLIIAAVLAAGGLIGGRILLERNARKPFRPESAVEVEFTVPKGAPYGKVGQLLADAGLIKSARLWRIYERVHKGGEAKAGRHKLSPAMSLIQVREAVAMNPLPEDEPLKILEFWRLRDTDAELAALGRITAGAYIAAASDPKRFNIPFEFSAPTLEGYLYPETYMIPKGPIDVDKLIQRQIDAFHARFASPYSAEIAKSGRTLHQIVIMGSMLEREEPKPENRPLVAGILFKRLDKGHALGVDATSRYTIPDWNDRVAFLKQLRDPEDPYNTRLRKGLPPGPIGAATVPSLLGALNPEMTTKYWYYLHDANKNLHPSPDGDEHERKRKQFNVY